jgi:AcrR family transcriptional regulator
LAKGLQHKWTLIEAIRHKVCVQITSYLNDRSFNVSIAFMKQQQTIKTRELRTEHRRDTIVQAALHCFIEKGFHLASMRDIAAQAGVSVGNVYNHFPAKENLIAEIAALEMQELAPLIEELAKASPLEGLLSFSRDYTAVCTQAENVLLSSEVIAESARNPVLAGLFAENHSKLVSAIAHAIERGIQAGEVDSELPASTTAALVLDAIEGHALRAVLFATKKSQRKKAEDDLGVLLRKLLTA